MSTSNLTQKDEETIKTLCEYLLFDQYQDMATYPRFEQCFQPILIIKIIKINLKI